MHQSEQTRYKEELLHTVLFGGEGNKSLDKTSSSLIFFCIFLFNYVYKKVKLFTDFKKDIVHGTTRREKYQKDFKIMLDHCIFFNSSNHN